MLFKLLLTQANSPLGSALHHDLERESVNLLLPQAEDVDWRHAESVSAYIQQKCPELVINNYAWDTLDTRDGQDAYLAAATHLAAACADADIPLIHLSGYQVFSGNSKSTHSEKDNVDPVTAQGKTLVAAEQAIARLCPRHICLRLGWVIGAYGDNLLTRLLGGYLGGQAVQANRRLRGAPTTLADVARVLVGLYKQISCGSDNWGIMHYCSGDACTQEEFAEQLLQLLIQQQLLTAEPSLTIIDDENTDEPASAILTCRVIRDCFGVQARSWRPSLLPLVKQWLHNRGE
ncbi:sugar nucleotide-binding protein [Cellvibrio japonicus]|uniref:dTDP-4-dehydrorhamnose reductase n=1 Tax=Cellvibrio japonicus (strain Ueda107) TaxID=498211 RepID=B3PK86_CELJU|nr:sugar nucleotide-binding protein [Cellvibrio japonicus]ACE82707.1 dTDP-4-rhamnose reductase-related protein [Cellvibrio japonicus Ueda107]QEI11404.1 sugar nucleotide-binding protein [Cellvibrio japonicus]QEI14978.1 sugar nucleotide-binding protein [Cellvibrio japonicus]QEI18558.1 sugar nucleotide-binding protein [Cellvibrio japonicus]